MPAAAPEFGVSAASERQDTQRFRNAETGHEPSAGSTAHRSPWDGGCGKCSFPSAPAWAFGYQCGTGRSSCRRSSHEPARPASRVPAQPRLPPTAMVGADGAQRGPRFPNWFRLNLFRHIPWDGTLSGGVSIASSHKTGLGPAHTTRTVATGAGFSESQERGATHTGRLRETSDAEIGETGPVPPRLRAKTASAFVVVLALEWPKSSSSASPEAVFARNAIRSGSVNRP